MIDNESGEDYLEAILRLAAKEKDVHAVDIAREIGVSKPAVTKAMRILIRKGYVDIVNNHIHLTAEGEKYAESVYEKHRLLTGFLTRLGVDAKTGETDACRMEHLISDETHAAIRKFMES